MLVTAADIIMEFAPHGNLGSMIHKMKIISKPYFSYNISSPSAPILSPIDEPDSIIVTRQLCSALLWLHNAGIIHRDIKPGVSGIHRYNCRSLTLLNTTYCNLQNILIHSFSPGIIKVADFGLAKAHDATDSPIHVS
jgi:serine/threonine protein kinase